VEKKSASTNQNTHNQPSFGSPILSPGEITGSNSDEGLTIDQTREILGDNYKNLTDQEIDQIRISCEIQARIALNIFKNKLTLESKDGGTDND
jgi:hypothetical protein